MNEPHAATQTNARRPWQREPLVWLVIAIPALTVVAGLSTVFIAHHTADVEVSDDVRREGLAIHQDPARDNAATALGVSAQLSLAAGHVHLSLAPGTAKAPATLLVVLSHATRAEFDQLVPLAGDGNGGYDATIAPLKAGHWYLEVTPTDRAWRLTGEFSGSDAELALAPESASQATDKAL